MEPGSTPSKWASLGRLVRELRASSPNEAGVSKLATVGVGEVTSGALTRADHLPTRPALHTPSRNANPTTRIFVVAPAPEPSQPSRSAAVPPPRAAAAPNPPLAKVLIRPNPNVTLPRKTEMFTPVANSTRSVSSKLVQTFAGPTFTAEPDAGRHGPPRGRAPAPLLRAFDDARAREPTWATATTLSAPRSQLEARERAAKAQGEAPGDTAQPARSTASGGALRDLRGSPLVTKALVAAVTAIVCSGALATRGMWTRSSAQAARRGSAIATAVAPAPAPLRAAPAATVSAPPARAAHVEPIVNASTAPAVPETADVAPGELTLARRAVDAVLSGDRSRAREYYQQLSRQAPDREVYREALRLLAPSKPETPQ